MSREEPGAPVAPVAAPRAVQRLHVSRAGVLVALATLVLVLAVVLLGALRLRAHPETAGLEIVTISGVTGPGSKEPVEGDVGTRDARTGTPADSTDSTMARGTEASRGLRIALVQGGYGSDLDEEQTRHALSDYLDLSRRAATSSADLIVWPESNVPYAVEGSAGYLDRLAGLSRSSGAGILLGSVGGDEVMGPTNSAYLIGPSGILDRYDKRRLVQYGEYVPLKSIFPFIRKFVPEAGDFVPGKKLGVMPFKERTIGVAICYEMIFPEEILLQARAGTDLLVNLTNDSWFPGDGPWQHADFSPMRAIETGLWTARAASTGRTLLVDPMGRLRAELPMGGAGVLVGQIPPPESRSRGGSTFFVRNGEWAARGCATITALALAFLVVGNIIDKRWRG